MNVLNCTLRVYFWYGCPNCHEIRLEISPCERQRPLHFFNTNDDKQILIISQKLTAQRDAQVMQVQQPMCQVTEQISLVFEPGMQVGQSLQQLLDVPADSALAVRSIATKVLEKGGSVDPAKKPKKTMLSLQVIICTSL